MAYLLCTYVYIVIDTIKVVELRKYRSAPLLVSIVFTDLLIERYGHEYYRSTGSMSKRVVQMPVFSVIYYLLQLQKAKKYHKEI